MSAVAVPAPGFDDPVHGAQRAFRAALEALARPGRIQALGAPVPGLPLGAAMAHLLLALTDEDTPVWWQAADAQLARWLRFHTGARLAGAPQDAAFAVVTEPAAMPALSAFGAGTLAAPERSCTVLLALPALEGGARVAAHGPGIASVQPMAPAGLPPRFWAEWQANHAAFPQGVDVFFTCADRVLGLPRSTRIARLEGVN